jgi:hypothetical protein
MASEMRVQSKRSKKKRQVKSESRASKGQVPAKSASVSGVLVKFDRILNARFHCSEFLVKKLQASYELGKQKECSMHKFMVGKECDSELRARSGQSLTAQAPSPYLPLPVFLCDLLTVFQYCVCVCQNCLRTEEYVHLSIILGQVSPIFVKQCWSDRFIGFEVTFVTQVSSTQSVQMLQENNEIMTNLDV